MSNNTPTMTFRSYNECKLLICQSFSVRLCTCYYAPNFEKVGDILVSACPYVCMYVCLYVCMYVCMYSCSRYRLETSCMDSSWKIADTYFWFSLNYLPLSNYGPLTNKGMKFCKCRISKSIIARNLKLVSADRG